MLSAPPPPHRWPLLLLPSIDDVDEVEAQDLEPVHLENWMKFIRMCCGTTWYLRLCFSFMVGYVSKVQGSPVHVALLAINLTVDCISSIAHRPPGGAAPAMGIGWKATALSDYTEALGDAADEAWRMAAELVGLKKAAGPEVAWQVSNGQMWMSAALTNEETCTNGFESVGPYRVKAEVCCRVRRVKHFTSNTLALINNLVTTH